MNPIEIIINDVLEIGTGFMISLLITIFFSILFALWLITNILQERADNTRWCINCQEHTKKGSQCLICGKKRKWWNYIFYTVTEIKRL